MIFIIFTLASCVHNDDYNTPDITISEPEIPGNIISISAVKGSVAQIEDGIYTFTETTDYMEGYVISSDEGGNFFEEIVLQDKPENPTAGIVMQVDVNPLFTKYEFGRKIYIKLAGLTAATENGTIQLGIRDGGTIAPLQSSLLDEYIIRSTEVSEIIPLKLSITDFSDEKENLFIQLNNVQFNRKVALGENRKTFASEATDEFDGERILESCDEHAKTILSTSTYSDFKALLLPQGSGTVNGILSRDFYDEFYVVAVNSPADINFENESRCDPLALSCGIAAAPGAKVIFEDDFEEQKKNKPITGNGWTNYTEAGSVEWEAYVAADSNASQGISARVDSYSSGDASTIAWLITPAVDLSLNPSARLHFETSNSFADGSELEILISKDWDGLPETISTSTWGILSDAYVTQDNDNFGDWYGSGQVDLSCESGTAYIAFKFMGNGRDANDGTYELDNIKITAD
ncbi:MAG: DUF5689 domain-containing protein [Leeuwenhoekiella sp.]